MLLSFVSTAQQELTFEQVVNRVLTHNYGIQLAKVDTEVAQNNNNPGNAGYLPTIDLEATQDFTISDSRQEYITGDINEATNANNRSFNAGAMLNWTFFDGFKMFATDKKLDELEQMSELNLRASMEMKIYEVAVNYYTLLSLQEMEEIYQEAIELSQLRVDFTSSQYKNGAATKVQLLQAQLDLTADSSAYISNQQSKAEIQTTLNAILALPSEQEIVATSDWKEVEERTEWEDLSQTFLEQNTTIMQAKSKIAVSELSTKEAKSRFYPQLSFYANYNYGTSVNEVGFLKTNRTIGSSFGITAKWSILNHLSRSTELKNKRLDEKRSELSYQNDSISGMADLRNYYKTLDFAQEKLSFEKRNISQTTSIVDITKQAFQAGSITPLELREIQYSAIQAKGRLLQAQLEYQTARLNISLLSGGFQALL
jgi:outer membrane protein TolC